MKNKVNNDLIIKKQNKNIDNRKLNEKLVFDEVDKKLIELCSKEELIEYDFVGSIIPNEKYRCIILLKEKVEDDEKYKAEILVTKKIHNIYFFVIYIDNKIWG